MTKCPHCAAPVNPVCFSVYTTFAPYCCRRCGKQSRFNRRTMLAIGGFGGLTGALLASVFSFSLRSGLLTAAGLTLAVMAGLVLGLRLQPAE